MVNILFFRFRSLSLQMRSMIILSVHWNTYLNLVSYIFWKMIIIFFSPSI